MRLFLLVYNFIRLSTLLTLKITPYPCLDALKKGQVLIMGSLEWASTHRGFYLNFPKHALYKQKVDLTEPFPFGDEFLLRYLCLGRCVYGEEWQNEQIQSLKESGYKLEAIPIWRSESTMYVGHFFSAIGHALEYWDYLVPEEYWRPAHYMELVKDYEQYSDSIVTLCGSRPSHLIHVVHTTYGKDQTVLRSGSLLSYERESLKEWVQLHNKNDDSPVQFNVKCCETTRDLFDGLMVKTLQFVMSSLWLTSTQRESVPQIYREMSER